LSHYSKATIDIGELDRLRDIELAWYAVFKLLYEHVMHIDADTGHDTAIARIQYLIDNQVKEE
jgi:hypothetical protein